MRNIFFVVFLLFVSNAFSQQAVVSADKMNVLYIGIDNPISIAVENYSCKDLKVENSQGYIIRSESNPCSYNVKVTKPGKTFITVKDKKGKVISEHVFRAKHAPSPIAKIAGISEGVISKTKLLAQKGITTDLENFDFDFRYFVRQYTIATCSNNTIHTEHVGGPLFSDKVYQLIKNANDGDVIIFDDISAGCPGCTTRKLNQIKLFITYRKEEICKGKLFNLYGSYPADTTYILKNDQFRSFQNICTCKAIDIAIGKEVNFKKTGWWDYKEMKMNDTLLVRREYYNGDTIRQEFYESGIKSRTQLLIDGILLGEFNEFYSNETIKVKGYYSIDTFTIDTIIVIDPITLEETIVTEVDFRSLKSGIWQYFNEQGILVKEEKYNKGQLVKP
jgi:antitoxin component YwqK of YwqJK toxin-antitoxin module